MTTIAEFARTYVPQPKVIQLTQGKQALVDEDTYPILSSYKWHAVSHGYTWYAYATPKHNVHIAMHRLILGVNKSNQIIDHKDCNGLNNQLSNLRLCSHAQNKANICLYKNNTSGYRGVLFDKSRKKWMAKMKVNGKTVNLGRFNDKETAIQVRQKKAQELWGEFVYPIQLKGGLKS